jgi:hypothetical protein
VVPDRLEGMFAEIVFHLQTGKEERGKVQGLWFKVQGSKFKE